jgi:Mg-chelatase subunit ChlD
MSWHFTPDIGEYAQYDGEWDKQENTTLGKLESAISAVLRGESLSPSLRKKKQKTITVDATLTPAEPQRPDLRN